VRVWQPAIGRMIRIVRGHGGPIFSVAYSADGSRLFSAGQEGIVRIIDADSDRILHEWRAHDDWIYATAVSPDGAVLVSGDWAGTVKLWDIQEGQGTLLWTWPRLR
jgi:WD40 repeat protein